MPICGGCGQKIWRIPETDRWTPCPCELNNARENADRLYQLIRDARQALVAGEVSRAVEILSQLDKMPED